jgi:pimeloyl-ACP methyl ester carboxylesterase
MKIKLAAARHHGSRSSAAPLPPLSGDRRSGPLTVVGKTVGVEFVLVHGTTQSPAGWDLLARVLEAGGHRCHRVDLATVDSGCPVAGYAEAVTGELSLRSPVIVAHSGSGLLLPALARSLCAARQVFLAAWIPDGALSLMDEFEANPEIFPADWIGQDPTNDPDTARRFLFHDCDDRTAEWALSTLRSFDPSAAYHEVVPLAPEIPATVIVPMEDRTLRTEWMTRAAVERLGIEPVMVQSGHCPHVSRPELIAEILTATS